MTYRVDPPENAPGNAPGNANLLIGGSRATQESGDPGGARATQESGDPRGARATQESGDPGRGEPVWHREYWDRFIRNERHYRQAVDYIQQNPVKAGLVRNPPDWRWSSAAALATCGRDRGPMQASPVQPRYAASLFSTIAM